MNCQTIVSELPPRAQAQETVQARGSRSAMPSLRRALTLARAVRPYQKAPYLRGGRRRATLLMNVLAKRKVCSAVAVVVALIAITLWMLAGSVETVAGLTRQDIVQIRREVRKQVWREFHPVSRLYLQNDVPSRLIDACRSKIHIASPQPDGQVQAVVDCANRAVLYSLSRQSGHWVIDGRPLVLLFKTH